MTLRDVLAGAAREQPEDWLFLAGTNDCWALDSEAYLLNVDSLNTNPETHEPILPSDIASKGLHEALDVGTIVACVENADHLVGRADDAVRLESFLYYVHFE